jgi:hypothetical protein
MRRPAAGLAILLGTAALVVAAAPAGAARPARVTLDGEWQIDRREHDACFVAAPPMISGRLHLEADFETGTVTGWLDGQGSGSYTVPAECKHENPDDYDRWNLETWEAEFTVVRGEFSGDLDSATGSFEVEATISVEAGLVRDAPDARWMCGTDYWTDTCIYSYGADDAGVLSGVVQGADVNRGEIDWYAPFCAAMSPDRVTWTDQGCPHEGSWQATVTDVVWMENRPPRIIDVTVEPEAPREGEPVVLTAVTHDPDGDELTFRWTVDGTAQGVGLASMRWPAPGVGDHWVELEVEDGQGGSAETSLGFSVAAVAPPVAEEAESATTSLGADPLARPDEEETTWSDEEAAAPDEPWAMWETGSSRLPQGGGLLVLIFAVLAGVFSGSLLVGYLVRLRMGWGRQEAAEDAVRAEGLAPPTDEGVPLSWFEVLREGQYQQQGGRPEPGWTPPGAREPPQVSSIQKTPTAYHQTRPGLQPGSYRWVEFPEPVYLEQPIPGGGVELITTQLTGPVLIGSPDPVFPGHSPAYDQAGKRLGWVRTSDLPK